MMEGLYKLPEGWVWCKLPEIADVIMGQSPPSITYNLDGRGLPFYQGKAEFGELYPEPVKWCSKPKKIAENNDILLSVRAPVGPTNIAPAKSCIGRGLAAIRPLGNIPNLLILYYFRMIERTLASSEAGSTFGAIGKKDIKTILFPLPPLTEQHRIVNKLKTILNQINDSEKYLGKVDPIIKRFRQSLLFTACSGGLSKDWRNENPDIESVSELLKQIREERIQKYEEECRKAKVKGKRKPKKPINLKYAKQHETNPEESPELPESWLWVNLGEVVNDFQPGFACGARDDQGYIQLRMNNIGLNGSVVLDKTLKVPKEHTNLVKYKLQMGDILFNNTNSVELIGKTVIFRDEIQNCVYSNHTTRIRPENRLIYPEFLLYILMDNFNQGVFRMMCHRFVGQAGISREKLLRLTIPLPPLSEQNMIIENVKYLFEFSNSIEQRVSKATNYTNQLVQSILAKAFRGELVPQDPNDKPASELLDRIKKERQKKASKEKLKYKRNNPTKLNDYL